MLSVEWITGPPCPWYLCFKYFLKIIIICYFPIKKEKKSAPNYKSPYDLARQGSLYSAFGANLEETCKSTQLSTSKYTFLINTKSKRKNACIPDVDVRLQVVNT